MASIPELIDKLRCSETDWQSANVAAATIEHCRVPAELKDQLREALAVFIDRRLTCAALHDQVALRCALRRYIFIQGDCVYLEVRRLLGAIPPDFTTNRAEIVTTFAEFLQIRTPTEVVNAPGLAELLSVQCGRLMISETLAFPELRVMAVQCLLALILMGRDEALPLIDAAMAIGPARRYLAQRAEDIAASLGQRGAGSVRTLQMLDRIVSAAT